MVALCGSGSRRRDAVNGTIKLQILFKNLLYISFSFTPEYLVVHQNRILKVMISSWIVKQMASLTLFAICSERIKAQVKRRISLETN